MMNFLSRFRKQVDYLSLSWHESAAFPGVRFAVRKASLSQRLELIRQIKELTLHHEFLKAGDVTEQLDATMADLLVRRLYLEWGLQTINGLRIDGRAATKDSLMEKGPEPLIEEMLGAIKSEIELQEEEIKNS